MGDEPDSTFEREREIFFAALEKKTEGSRARYLEETCGGDGAMLARVREMLKQHHTEDSDTFLVSPAIVDEIARLADPKGETRPFNPPEANEIADLIPGLKIVDLLGAGGMGAVYKARQPALDRFVAVKLLPESSGRDPQFRERFLREAQALAKLNHPNIVTIHDFGEAEGYFYFVMELVDGVDLAKMMKREKLSVAEALTIIPQICDALEFAHRRDVVHRDIKPANILLNKEGRVKIADFGLAKIVGSDPADSQLTRSDVAMGTPRYMAPEQVETPLDVDHRADIYSVGVLFYEMLTGELPVGNFKVPSKKISVDVRIDEVVLRTLEKEPELRYQRASEIKKDVERATTEVGASKAAAAARRKWLAVAAAFVVVGAVAVWAIPHLFSNDPRTNSLGMQFVEIPGSGVLFSVWETRVGDYEAFVEATGHPWKRPEYEQGSNEPAVNISFDDARAFCDWLTERERGAGNLQKGERYRLPSDDEWSVAVGLEDESGSTPETRHGKITGVYPWGSLAPAPSGAGNYPDTALKEKYPASKVIPGYYDGFPTTAPVGSFPQNDLGIHDLGGNVSEWTSTPFSKGNPSPVLRGGSWWNSFRPTNWSEVLQSSWRRFDVGLGLPGLGLNDVGFRPVLEISSPDQERSEDGSAGLLEAAEEGDTARVTALLDSGKADPDETDPEGVTALMLASKQGSVPMVELLLDRGADIEAADKRGAASLIYAVAGRKPEAVRILLDRGARVSASENSGQTAVTKAIATGQEKILVTLLDAAPDPESEDLTDLFMECINYGNMEAAAVLIGRGTGIPDRDSSGNPLLCTALLGGHDEIARLLLEEGGDPNVEYLGGGLPPLGVAAMMGNVAIAEELLEQGAKIEVPDGGTPILHIAAKAGHAEIVSLLLDRGADPLIKSKFGETALNATASEITSEFADANLGAKQLGIPPEVAAPLLTALTDLFGTKRGTGKRTIVRRLIDEGVPIDFPNSDGSTPLNTAAHHGALDVVEELVARGALIDQRDDAGFTPLLSAAEKGRHEIVQILHEAGADMAAKEKRGGRNALHLAASAGKLKLVAYIVSTDKLKVDAINAASLTALHHAAWEGYGGIARFLLENGADPDLATGAGGGFSNFTPLHFASAGIEMMKNSLKGEKIEEALGKKRPGDTRPLNAESRNYFGVVKMLVDHGADIEATDGFGFSPLARAAWWNHGEAITLLAERGAEVDTKGRGGTTPLIHAASRGNTRAVETLLDLGADIAAKDNHSATALHWCAISGDVKTARLLMERGADIEARDLNYATPLHKAAFFGKDEIVRALYEKDANHHARNVDGMTPAHSARVNDMMAVATFLEALPDKR